MKKKIYERTFDVLDMLQSRIEFSEPWVIVKNRINLYCKTCPRVFFSYSVSDAKTDPIIDEKGFHSVWFAFNVHFWRGRRCHPVLSSTVSPICNRMNFWHRLFKNGESQYIVLVLAMLHHSLSVLRVPSLQLQLASVQTLGWSRAPDKLRVIRENRPWDLEVGYSFNRLWSFKGIMGC